MEEMRKLIIDRLLEEGWIDSDEAFVLLNRDNIAINQVYRTLPPEWQQNDTGGFDFFKDVKA